MLNLFKKHYFYVDEFERIIEKRVSKKEYEADKAKYYNIFETLEEAETFKFGLSIIKY